MDTPEGSRGMPPTLTIGECDESSLQQLIDAWHSHSGMRTCFHEATELLGIHLDRLTRDSSGAISRAAWTIEIEPV